MTATDVPTFSGEIGSRRLRKEDSALLTGEARNIDDLDVPGALWAGIVRSRYAHARITAIDTSDALGMPGVHSAYTGADLEHLWAAPMPCAWAVTDDMANPPHLPVAVGTAHFAGDPVAVVLADTRTQAVDAAEAVVVESDPRPAAGDLEAAAADEVIAHEDLGTNTCYTWELTPDPDAVDAAFAAAAHTVSERYVQQRLIPSAMETRGVAAVPSPHGGDITIYSATQIPHILKVMTAITLGLPEQKIRVIAPAVGGGFGSKLQLCNEEFLCTALAHDLGRAVRWTETRSEAAEATHHGRAQIQHIELAADEDGRISAVRVNLTADMGAYLMVITPGTPLLGAFVYHGAYDIPAYSFTCTGVFTNKTPTDAYRGAGRPEATYAIERAMDALARETGIDPVELRRRNFITDFPYDSGAGLTFDTGDYGPALDKALEMIDADAVRQEQEKRRKDGSTKHLGLGISTYVEMCGLAPSSVLGSLNYAAGGWEAATVRMLPTGKVQVVSGTSPHGQGHETSWSMIVADRLGVDPDDVEVLHSDTAIAPLGMDTYGSRSLPVGGVAVWMAMDKLLDKARTIAAHQMEAAADDLEFVDGAFQVKGSPSKQVELTELAFPAFSAHDLPDGLDPNLEGQATYDPPNFSYPFGTHLVVVEIDEDTGQVDLVDYVAVDDCGVQINPMIVEGQVHGGIAQGVAQALWEEAVYDDEVQLRTVTLGDYLVPSAAELPTFQLDHTVTPSTTNPLGVKGIGEAGAIASTPAVMNAVVDALSPFGITDIDMPASPHRVWSAIQAAKAGQS